MANDLTHFERGGGSVSAQTSGGSTFEMALMNPDTFNHMYRVGAVLASSPLFPEHLRKGSKEEREANGMLVVNMAMRHREDPLTVAQNIYFVGGRPGWNATYMIAKANQFGAFQGPIDWEVTGKGDTLAVEAHGVLARSGKTVCVTADMDMAKAEGWTRNPKYKSMPEQMLRYRSAVMLIRLYCPEVMVGMPASVELEDERGMRDVTPKDSAAEDVMSALPETNEEAPRRKVDRTPPPAAQTVDAEEEGEDEEEQTDSHGMTWNPDIHSTPASRNADGSWRMRRGRKEEYEAAIAAHKAAQAEQEGDDEGEGAAEHDDAQGEPQDTSNEAQGENQDFADPEPMLEAIRKATTEEELQAASTGAGGLAEDDRARVRTAYGDRLISIRAERQIGMIEKDLQEVSGEDVEAVMESYASALSDIEQHMPEAYGRLVNLADERANA